MSSDNRISAEMSAEDVTGILASIAAVRSKLPFLLNLSAQERRELPKMGDKSIGFDDKCRTYMASNPEFLPGFIDVAEVNKDRNLRGQLSRVFADLISLTDSVEDTLRVVASEAWMADLAYYQSVREAAKRGRAGAQGVYDDLQQRFPGAPTLAQRAARSGSDEGTAAQPA
ncbi:MAG: hypothetical protein OJJ21_06455 [Ferrovibrio sp.]|uniref:hypothetical protein n=1 Tax=Ferrovibrio sp. TaxID=1917215 RepID=UPI0026379891|nr:hypothetical protein [Ferrovibrio sp.]MCW0233219.1 hypothetical protein [Ferrovibrio sp.]